MKPICIIPARGGSKGIAKKNIKIIAGKPLLGHVIENIKKGNIFSHIIVSTEDKEIAKIAKKYGAEVPFVRPKKFATDTASMDEVLLHAIQTLYELKYEFEIFVWRDATTPLIKNSDIKRSIELLKKEKSAAAVCGVYIQHLNPYFNMVEKNKQGFLKLSKKLKNRPLSRQEAPIVYQLNGLYAYNAKKFLKLKKTDFSKSKPYEIPMETGIMIDTPFEFEIVKLFLENKKIIKNKMK